VSRVVIVGGGILGTMHAVEARRRGWDVVQLERDAEPRSATVRNFGMVWISGRAPGRELDAALRSRAIWAELGRVVPALGFRGDGSLLCVTEAAEHRVLEEVVARDDATARQFELLDGDAARRVNPFLGPEVAAALWCRADAKVEPAAALPALRHHLLAAAGAGGYTFVPGVAARHVDAAGVTDHTGGRHDGDLVIVCPGASPDGAASELLDGAPLRRVRLQMMQTVPLSLDLPTMLADADSLRYYPGFDVPARAELAPPDPIVAEFHTQLLVAQRLDRSLTVGDTHEYTEPFTVGLDPRPEEHLMARLAHITGVDAPRIARRWAGVYSQCLDDRLWYREVIDGVAVVNGPGGRGMTLSAAIGEDTFAALLDGRETGWATPTDGGAA
jgi:FAD dependent oxidoreductase TIGR03364